MLLNYHNLNTPTYLSCTITAKCTDNNTADTMEAHMITHAINKSGVYLFGFLSCEHSLDCVLQENTILVFIFLIAHLIQCVTFPDTLYLFVKCTIKNY